MRCQEDPRIFRQAEKEFVADVHIDDGRGAGEESAIMCLEHALGETILLKTFEMHGSGDKHHYFEAGAPCGSRSVYRVADRGLHPQARILVGR